MSVAGVDKAFKAQDVIRLGDPIPSVLGSWITAQVSKNKLHFLYFLRSNVLSLFLRAPLHRSFLGEPPDMKIPS